jgi:hypothetical protein
MAVAEAPPPFDSTDKSEMSPQKAVANQRRNDRPPPTDSHERFDLFVGKARIHLLYPRPQFVRRLQRNEHRGVLGLFCRSSVVGNFCPLSPLHSAGITIERLIRPRRIQRFGFEKRVTYPANSGRHRFRIRFIPAAAVSTTQCDRAHGAGLGRPWPLSAKAAAIADMVWRRQLTHSRHGTKKDSAVQQGVVGSRNERYRTSPSSGSTSLRLDVGRPDHLSPLLGFLGNELAEVGRRTHQCGSA